MDGRPPTSPVASPDMTVSVPQQADQISPSERSGHGQNNGAYLSPSDDSKPRVVYKVEYRDKYYGLLETKIASHPLELHSLPDDHTVLEISSVLTTASTQYSSKDDLFVGQDAPNLETSAAGAFYEGNSSQMGPKTITIYSEKLANALRAVVQYYPSVSLIDRSISITEPYMVLCHHSAELEAYRDSHPSQHSEVYRKETNKDIDLLLSVLRLEKPEVAEEKERYQRSSPVCTFNLLWLLFKPGEACYRRSETGETSASIVRAIKGGSSAGRLAPYRVYTWQLNFDGYKVGRELIKTVIAPFGGEREIRVLDCFPCRFYKDPTENVTNNPNLRQRLVARGQKFWKLTRGRPYVEYSGINLVYPFERVESRVMVDPKTFFSSRDYLNDIDGDKPKIDILKPHLLGLEPPRLRARYYQETSEDREMAEMTLDGDIMLFNGCQCDACGKARPEITLSGYGDFATYSHLRAPEDDPPNEEEFFFLCSYKIVAFVLRERKWKLLNVEHVQEIVSRSNAFDHLVLEPELKGVVEGLSRSYARWKQLGQKSIATDFIEGKGEGQVFLLHGPPGVGKTATAEAIADFAQRPLLALTCGDLGTYSVEVEEKLGQYLDWGELWGAVVLLDEADIYLEKRNLTDVHRNSLVSVFLRALEYYKGLLFLTTNRVNTFDEAFTSRIHVALHYKKLGDEERKKIWINSFERLESSRVKIAKTARKYACESKEVLDLKWNGREIRNAFQTVISLAEVDAEEDGEELVTVRKEHLEKVVHLSAHFQRYLVTMHKGMSDSEMAKRRGLRNDAFDEMPKKGKTKQQLFRNRFVQSEEEEDDDKGEDKGEDEDKNPRRKGDRSYRPGTVRSKDVEENSEEDLRKKSMKGKKAVRYAADEESEEEPPRKPTKNKKSVRSQDEESAEQLPRKPTKNKKIARPKDEESDDKTTAKPTKNKNPVEPEDERAERPKTKKLPKKPTRASSDDDSEEET